MSTPDQLHVVTVSSAGGSDGDIMRLILGQENSFEDVNDQESNGSELQFSVVDCTGAIDTLHLCGIEKTNLGLYHTFCDADGNWQDSYDNVNDENPGGPSQFKDVSCGGNASLETIHVCAVGTDGLLYHTTVDADGNWQGYYDNVSNENSGGQYHPDAFTHVDCAVDSGGDLWVFGTDTSKNSWYTILRTNEGWSGAFSPISNVVGLATDISCAIIGDDTHVCIVSALSGLIGHTAYSVANGSWQKPPDAAPSYDPHTSSARFWNVDCANVNDVLHVCGTGMRSDIWHNVRDSNGNWQPTWENVSQETNCLSYPVVSVGGVV